MNLNHLLYKSRKNIDLHSNNGTRLYGYKLVIARTVWLTLFSLFNLERIAQPIA